MPTAISGNDVSVNSFSISEEQVLIVEDQKASGGRSGTSVTGVYTKRDINTVITNTILGASLSSNQITLPVGEYLIKISAPAYASNSHKIKLWNVSDAISAIVGSSETAGPGGPTTRSFINSYLLVSATKVFEILHRVDVGVSLDGFGLQTTYGTDKEVYTQVYIKKIG